MARGNENRRSTGSRLPENARYAAGIALPGNAVYPYANVYIVAAGGLIVTGVRADGRVVVAEGVPKERLKTNGRVVSRRWC